MPLLNPRTSKLKTIIKEINSQYNNKEGADNLAELDQNTQDSPGKTPSSSTNDVQIIQQVRRSFSPSGSSHHSFQDYSPASDNDREYKPSSHEDSSSESDNATEGRTSKKKQKRQQKIVTVHASPPKSVCDNSPALPKTSRSFSSSKSSSSSRSLNSSGSSSSPGSSSSSGTSSSTDSDSNSSDSDAMPSKRECIMPSALQLISLQYTNDSASEDDDKINTTSHDSRDVIDTCGNDTLTNLVHCDVHAKTQTDLSCGGHNVAADTEMLLA